MVQGLIGKKVAMTQLFDEEDGRAWPVTVLQAGPCVVVQKKSLEVDGYSAVQLGFVDPNRRARANQPLKGHFEKAGVPPTRVLKEFGFEGSEEELQVGDLIQAHTLFQPGDRVHLTGRTIGRGFQGVIKRHGFHGGRATHGSMFHRAPGSIGASAYPSRVYPGMKGAGRMGNKRVTIRNLRVVLVDEEKNLLAVQGAVPGSRGSIVYIARAGAPGKAPTQQSDQDNA